MDRLRREHEEYMQLMKDNKLLQVLAEAEQELSDALGPGQENPYGKGCASKSHRYTTSRTQKPQKTMTWEALNHLIKSKTGQNQMNLLSKDNSREDTKVAAPEDRTRGSRNEKMLEKMSGLIKTNPSHS